MVRKLLGRKKNNRNLSLIFKGRKANLFMDLMLVVLVLLGMAILAFVGKDLFTDLNADIQEDADMPTNAKALSADLNTRFPTFMDGAFLLATILLWIFVLVSSVMIDSHPMFFVISLILLLFALGVVMMLGNTFEEFASDSEYTGLETQFPITYFIMTNLLNLILIMGGSVLIALYGKNKFIGG